MISVRRRLLPGKAEPADGIDDRIDVFLLLLLGIGVVETQMAAAAVILRQPEVQADRLGVAEVQVAVGFGRKARADLRRIERPGQLLGGRTGTAGPAARRVLAGGELALDDVADEVGAGKCRGTRSIA